MMSFRRLLLLLTLLVPLKGAGQDKPRPGEVVDDLLSGDMKEHYVTRVRIAGTTSISENDALGLIGDRLEHVRKQVPSASRASDAAFMARQLFRSHGFNQCDVTWKITGAASIQLIVKEGPRQDLGDVKVEGVDGETSKRLAKLFSSPSAKRRFGANQRPPFREADAEEGLAFIVSDFHSRGYWTATATIRERHDDPAKSTVNFTIATQPGPLHLISEPTIQGAGSNRDEIAREARAFLGKPADTAGVNQLRAAVETWYRKRGFTKAKVLMTSTLTNGKFIPGFIIEEGKSYRIGHITYNGLQKTKEWRLRQRMGGLEGKTLDDTVMEKRLRGLMGTGAFQTVRLQQVPVDDTTMDAVLEFTEGKARGYTASAGLASFEGPIFGVSYYDRNFRGMLWNFNSGFEITGRSILGDVSLTDPWLWGSDASGTARFFLLTHDNEGYSTWKTGVEGGVDWAVTDHYSMEAKLGWSFVNTVGNGIPGTQLGENVYQNPFIRFEQKLEYRDNPVLPTKGWHAEMPIEIGSAVGTISSGYVKAELSGAWLHPLGEKGEIALGARGGLLMPSGEDFDMPIDLRFFLGGASSVRSYAERELGRIHAAAIRSAASRTG